MTHLEGEGGLPYHVTFPAGWAALNAWFAPAHELRCPTNGV